MSRKAHVSVCRGRVGERAHTHAERDLSLRRSGRPGNGESAGLASALLPRGAARPRWEAEARARPHHALPVRPVAAIWTEGWPHREGAAGEVGSWRLSQLPPEFIPTLSQHFLQRLPRPLRLLLPQSELKLWDLPPPAPRA